MGDRDELQIRKNLRRAFSEEQVELLRSLRNELSSWRWQVMLEVDAAQEQARRILRLEVDVELRGEMEQMGAVLDRVHRALARIPEDFIPAF
jgi:hypothetical protein